MLSPDPRRSSPPSGRKSTYPPCPDSPGHLCQVWIRIIWQTGAVSEHKIRRNVSSYHNYADVATLEARVRDLVVARQMDREIARTLNVEGLLSAHGRPFSGGESPSEDFMSDCKAF
jgi:hypothetical protein